MKKLCLAVFSILLVLSACKPTPSEYAASSKEATIEKNLTISEKIYKAFETGDKAVIDSFISIDMIDHNAPNGKPLSGDSVRNMLANMHNHIKDLKTKVITQSSNGEYVFAYVQFTGTAADSSWGIPVGTFIDDKSVDLVRMKNFQVVEHWAFMDQDAVAKQIQAMQKKEPMESTKPPMK